MNTRKVLPEVKGGGERKREFYGLKLQSWSKAEVGNGQSAGGVGGGSDLLNEGETGRQHQYEGEGCGE